jgi:hypothetical protein
MPSQSSRDDPIGTIREVFFERLVPGRECGECVACCKILEINKPELKKPADTLCPHCTGTGCGIYAKRPEVCRDWHCLWRRIAELPDYLRPDKCGVVFSIDRHDPPRIVFEQIYIIARPVDETDADAIARPEAASAIAMFIEEGMMPVWIGFGGQKKMIYPDPKLGPVFS